MADRSANAILWAGVAIAALAFARSAADVDQWRADNGRYLERLRQALPDLAGLVEAFATTRAEALAP
jgi:hypothetical protein